MTQSRWHRHFSWACWPAPVALMAAAAAAQPCPHEWMPVGGGVDSTIRDLEVFDYAGGSKLFASGQFSTAEGSEAVRVAMWDGTSWYGFGPGLTGTVFAVCVFNDEVYAGGSFSQFTGHPKRVARWTGETWVDVGEGFNAAVRDLIVWDDGTGPALYACGDFSVLGGPNRVAKWNGTNWESLGLGVGLDGGGTNRPPANCMAVFDDGTGPALFVGGGFSTATNPDGTVINALCIAKWDGTRWYSVGGGVDSSVEILYAFDDGTGPALYVGGWFTNAGGVPANRIAKWNGQSWSALGSGLSNPVNGLTSYDDGTGPALYVSGQFTTAGDQPANYVAKWDGQNWHPLGSGMNVSVIDLATYDDGTGPAVYAGGGFVTAGGVSVARVARWACPDAGGPECLADWDGSGTVNSTDISAFLTSWLDSLNQGNLDADFDGSGQVNSTDISAFLTAWLADLSNGC